MSITVEEKWGRQLANDSAERGYILFSDGSDLEDEEAVYAALLANSPTTISGMPRQRPRIEEIDAGGCWIGIVEYGLSSFGQDQLPQPGDPSSAVVTFDTGGIIQHVTQSLETISSHAPAGEEAPDFKGAIGVVEDSNGGFRVEGADIDLSDAFAYSETHAINDVDVTTAYITTLYNLKGTVNDATWKSFDAGELLFVGAQGSKRSETVWEITYKFAARPNQTGKTIGDMTGIDAEGWELIWVLYEHEEETTSSGAFLVIRPRAAYVERVFEDGDFTTLNIGS